MINGGAQPRGRNGNQTIEAVFTTRRTIPGCAPHFVRPSVGSGLISDLWVREQPNVRAFAP